jgi:CheY-like chemotaxis protein
MKQKEVQTMRKTIVIIDDSPTVRAIVEQQLHRFEVTTKSFSDGIEAFGWLTFSHMMPDLLLIDVNLPKMNGFEVTRRILAHPALCTTSIVLMSGGDPASETSKAYKAGAVSYLHKPFTMESLLTTTSQTLFPVPPSAPMRYTTKGAF